MSIAKFGLNRDTMVIHCQAVKPNRRKIPTSFTLPRGVFAMLQELDQVNLEQAASLLHAHRARPSALHPLLKAVGTTLGLTTAICPPLQTTIHAAVSDALSELYDEQLRDVHEHGLVRACACIHNNTHPPSTGSGA